MFEPTGIRSLSAKVLLVSGDRDWVVPSGPEAIRPMRETGAARFGHRLVLVGGADHFNLRRGRGHARPALVGPMILSWLNEQLALPDAAPFSAVGWGDAQVPMVDASARL